MEGLWGWPLVVLAITTIFNAGGLVYMVTNHMSSLKKGLKELQKAVEQDCAELRSTGVKLVGEVHELAERVSHLEGRCKAFHDGGE